MKKENFNIKIISYIVVLILVGWFIYYLRNHWSDFMVIKSVSLVYLGLLIFAVLINMVVQGWIFKVIIEPFNIKLKFVEWFGLSVMTFLGNTIFPFGGFGFRAIYLKKKYDFNYTFFLSSLAAATIIELLMVTIGSLIGQLVIYFYFQKFSLILVLLSLFFVVICSIFLLVNFKLKESKNKILQKIDEVLNGLNLLRTNSRQMKIIFSIFIIYTLVLAAIFYFAFNAFNLKITIFHALISGCLSDYSVFINVLPASLGFYEGTIVFSANFFGFTSFQGLIVATLIRLVNISWLVLLGPIFAYLFFWSNKLPSSKFVGSTSPEDIASR